MNREQIDLDALEKSVKEQSSPLGLFLAQSADLYELIRRLRESERDAAMWRYLQDKMTWRERHYDGDSQPVLPEREWFHITNQQEYPFSEAIKAAMSKESDNG